MYFSDCCVFFVVSLSFDGLCSDKLLLYFGCVLTIARLSHLSKLLFLFFDILRFCLFFYVYINKNSWSRKKQNVMLMFRWKFDLSWSFKVKYYRELSITTICRIKSERWKHIWRCENSILHSKLTRHLFCCIFSMTMGIDMSWHRNKQYWYAIIILHHELKCQSS